MTPQSHSRFFGPFLVLLIIDIVLAFAYGVVPTTLQYARDGVSAIEYISMTITMGYAIISFLRSF